MPDQILYKGAIYVYSMDPSARPKPQRKGLVPKEFSGVAKMYCLEVLHRAEDTRDEDPKVTTTLNKLLGSWHAYERGNGGFVHKGYFFDRDSADSVANKLEGKFKTRIYPKTMSF